MSVKANPPAASKKISLISVLMVLLIACSLSIVACDSALGEQSQDVLQHEAHLNDESDSHSHDYTPLEIPFGPDMKIIVAPIITCTSNRNNTWHSHYNACKMAKTFPQDDDWSDNDANYTYIFEDWIDFDWNDIVVNVHASTTDGILSDLALAFREAAWMNPLGLEITAVGTWIRIQWNTTECEEVQFLTLGNGETRTIALFAESDLCDIAHLRFLIPPQANFTWHPEKPFVGETVVFDASSSIDYDDGIRFYSWVFDGEVSIYGENMTVSYKFRSPGNHSIKFAAVDWSGLEDCIRRELEVLAVVGGASGALDYALRTAWEYVNLLLLLTFLIAANLKRIK